MLELLLHIFPYSLITHQESRDRDAQKHLRGSGTAVAVALAPRSGPRYLRGSGRRPS